MQISRANCLVAGLSSALLLNASACVLAGIEPDEIDVADEETGGLGDAGGDGDGDGDGDDGGLTTGGQAEAGDGDGDPDPSGDGDGDPTTGDDGGDGDGDPTTGDGDGDGDGIDEGCTSFAPIVLDAGSHEVEILDGLSDLLGSCGGAGPETVYQFTAPSEGTWRFVLEQAEFEPVLTLTGSCEPLAELACSPAPVQIDQPLLQDQVVFVVVDSDSGAGTATLNIEML